MPANTPWDYDEDATDVGVDQPLPANPKQPWDDDDDAPEGKVNPLTPDPELDYFFKGDKTPMDRVLHAAKNAGSMADDIARLAARGITFGGADALAGKMTGEDELAKTNAARERLGGLGGAAAEMGGAVAGSLAMTPAAAVSTIPRAIATGMGMSGAQTAFTSKFDTGEFPEISEMLIPVATGGILGAVGGQIGKIFQRPRLNANTEKHIDVLNKEGIDVTSGQATRNRNMLSKEAAASGAQAFHEKQMENFSKAALRRAGIATPTGHLDPLSLAEGFEFVGKQMDQLASTHHIVGPEAAKVFPDMLVDAHQIVNAYNASIESTKAPIIANTLQAIAKAARTGKLDGSTFQDITSKLEAAARTNPKLATTAREMRGVLNAGMEKFITLTDPQAAGLWQMANRRYADLLVLENAYTRGGSAAAEGLITPQALANATKQIRGKRLYSRGMTTYDDLARAGVAYLHPLPISANGAPDEIIKIMSRKLGRMGAVGAGVHATTGSVPGAIAAAVGPELVGSLAGPMTLAPVASLSRTAASTGGAFGTAIGAGAATQNPFERAKQ